MAFRQHQHAGYPTIRREMMEMPMQDRRPSGERAFTQHRINVVRVVQIGRPPQIHDQMRPGVAHTVTMNEIILLGMRRDVFVGIPGVARQIRDHPRLDESFHSRAPSSQQMTRVIREF